MSVSQLATKTVPVLEQHFGTGKEVAGKVGADTTAFITSRTEQASSSR